MGLALRLGLGLGGVSSSALAAALSLDFTTGTLDPRITFSRASSGTYFDASGVLQLASTNAARFDHDPATLAAKGLLIEEQRTNLLLRSEEFDNASWTKSRTTVTANATTSPDGTVDADKLVEDTTASSTHRIFQQVSKAASSLTLTFSVYLKASERTLARLRVTDNIEAVFASIDIDLAAGTIGTALVAGGSSISSPSATILPAGNGWYRVTLTATLDATITTMGAFVFLRDGAGNISYTGDGTSGIFVWGAQLEADSFATSYIPTGASQVTRTADQASIVAPNFAPWYNQSEGTFVVEADTYYVDLNRIFTVSDGTTGNRIESNAYSANHLDVNVAGASQCSLDAGTFASNVFSKIAAAYKANDFAACIGGGAVATDTSGTVPTVDRLSIGVNHALGARWLNGHIKTLAFYNTRLPDATLQSLTT